MWCGDRTMNRRGPGSKADGIVLGQRPEIGQRLEAVRVEIGKL